MEKLQDFQATVNQYDPMAPVDAAWFGGPHVHGTTVYWRPATGNAAYVYTWGEQDYLRRHVLDLGTGRFDETRALAGTILGPQLTMPGGAISLSANGHRAGSAILWGTLTGQSGIDPRPPATLLAYDAETLELLWHTRFVDTSKWMPPTVAGGKVFVGTSWGTVLIYRLGPQKP